MVSCILAHSWPRKYCAIGDTHSCQTHISIKWGFRNHRSISKWNTKVHIYRICRIVIPNFNWIRIDYSFEILPPMGRLGWKQFSNENAEKKTPKDWNIKPKNGKNYSPEKAKKKKKIMHATHERWNYGIGWVVGKAVKRRETDSKIRAGNKYRQRTDGRQQIFYGA